MFATAMTEVTCWKVAARAARRRWLERARGGCGAGGASGSRQNERRLWREVSRLAGGAQGRRFSRQQCLMVHLSRWVRSPATTEYIATPAPRGALRRSFTAARARSATRSRRLASRPPRAKRRSTKGAPKTHYHTVFAGEFICVIITLHNHNFALLIKVLQVCVGP